jgi:phage terminase large subunit
MKGGSSSGKTFNLSSVVPSWILEGHNIIIARNSGNTLRRSIFSEITKAINRQGLQKYFDIKVTTLTIKSKVSGGCAMFVATSDEEKLKSITPLSSAMAFDICIMEEASEIPFSAQQQLRLRMRGRTSFDLKRTYMLLNPVSRNHVIYKKYYEVLEDPDNVGYITKDIHLHHSTYRDNPYLDQSEKDVLESMAEISPMHHEVYARGMWGTMTKTVYSNWLSTDIDYDSISHLPIRVGVDWGYVHPMTATFCAYDEAEGIFYVFDEIRLVEESLETLSEKLYEKIEEYGIFGVPVYCDTSEPRNRKVLESYGINAKKAFKPVNEGIEWMRRNKIIADKHKCFYTCAELSNYSWKEVNGEYTDEVIKENDDLCDAFRYSATEWTRESGRIAWGSKKALFAV